MRKALIALPLLLLVVAALAVTPDAPAESRFRGHFETVVADTDVSLWGVTMLDGGRIYLCGADGYFVRSTDAGKTWDAEQVKEGVSLRVMQWVDRKTGYVAGRTRTKNILLKTTDGGESFSEQSADVPFRVQGFTFFDRSNGWLVAASTRVRDGAWLKTGNGGRSWEKLESVAYGLPARMLNAITSIDGKHIWAVGSHVEIGLVGDSAKSLLYQKKQGAVLYSGDLGRSWTVQDAGNPKGTTLKDVDFVDSKNGYVVGAGGFMARTTDGGETWTTVKTGTTENLLAVDAVSPTAAFAVGDKGTAIGTKDAGANMSTFKTETTVRLRDCSFLTESIGYAVGRNGTVLQFQRDW